MPFHLISGSPDPERITGTIRRDLVTAGDGNDTIGSGGGGDRAYGEAGSDMIWGGFGSDMLYGGLGDDILTGAEYENGDIDHLYGGDGNDQLFTGEVVNYSYGGRGDDTVTLYFDVGGDAQGGSGDDLLVMNYVGSGLAASGMDSDVSLTFNVGATAGADAMTLSGFERLWVTTYTGNDIVTGGRGDDHIDVYTGANQVQALGGDDLVVYHTGAINSLHGGDGRDVLRLYQDAPSGALHLTVVGTDATDGYGSVLTGFEVWRVRGNSLDDHAQLGKGGDLFMGAAGNDTCYGMGGDDKLFGTDGEDALYGGNGDDHLRGGVGLDTLTGGAGADQFQFGGEGGLGDVITDMQSGVDQVWLRANLFDGALAVGQVDDALFHLDTVVGTGGQFVYRSATGELIWDANGTAEGGAMLIATLMGAPDLLAADLTILPLS